MLRDVFLNGIRMGEDRIDFPGSVSDFAVFLGSSPDKLEAMRFDQMEQLPGVKSRHLVAMGGGHRLGKHTFNWETRNAGENWERGEAFTGYGDDYNEAALMGLVAWWELLTRRRTQSSPAPVPSREQSTVIEGEPSTNQNGGGGDGR